MLEICLCSGSSATENIAALRGPEPVSPARDGARVERGPRPASVRLGPTRLPGGLRGRFSQSARFAYAPVPPGSTSKILPRITPTFCCWRPLPANLNPPARYPRSGWRDLEAFIGKVSNFCCWHPHSARLAGRTRWPCPDCAPPCRMPCRARFQPDRGRGTPPVGAIKSRALTRGTSVQN